MIPVLGRKQARGVRSIKWAQKAKKHLKTTGIMSKDSGANPLGHLLAKDGISEHQKKKNYLGHKPQRRSRVAAMKTPGTQINKYLKKIFFKGHSLIHSQQN